MLDGNPTDPLEAVESVTVDSVVKEATKPTVLDIRPSAQNPTTVLETALWPLGYQIGWVYLQFHPLKAETELDSDAKRQYEESSGGRHIEATIVSPIQ